MAVRFRFQCTPLILMSVKLTLFNYDLQCGSTLKIKLIFRGSIQETNHHYVIWKNTFSVVRNTTSLFWIVTLIYVSLLFVIWFPSYAPCNNRPHSHIPFLICTKYVIQKVNVNHSTLNSEDTTLMQPLNFYVFSTEEMYLARKNLESKPDPWL